MAAVRKGLANNVDRCDETTLNISMCSVSVTAGLFSASRPVNSSLQPLTLPSAVSTHWTYSYILPIRSCIHKIKVRRSISLSSPCMR